MEDGISKLLFVSFFVGSTSALSVNRWEAVIDVALCWVERVRARESPFDYGFSLKRTHQLGVLYHHHLTCWVYNHWTSMF